MQDEVEDAEQEGQGEQQGGKGEQEGGKGEYEFSPWEERVLQVVMDSLRMAGLALGLQAISSILLGADL